MGHRESIGGDSIDGGIGEIAARIFAGVKCQSDIDARKFEFVAALHEAGIQTPTIGDVLFWPAAPVPVMVARWHFINAPSSGFKLRD